MANNNTKRILDSVHGYIDIPKDVFGAVIDTVWFQRLRRIEQMSIRSLFPCARHDRFAHSLGVYFLGRKIIESIQDGDQCNDFPDNKDVVYKSYEYACLLHDVGHSPFSHTFEKFFDNQENNLLELLSKKIGNNDFDEDCVSVSNMAKHEIMSAYVFYEKFIDRINSMTRDKIDPELVARMIIGCKYYKDTTRSFENAFIDLIHGDVIDADGLDYVKRDTWASGYSAAEVDTVRLVRSICICKDNYGKWQVCYSPKALNEIESVIAIKRFQSNTVTHHTVVLEQELLIKAMESTAMYHICGIKDEKNKKKREQALEHMCDVNAMFSRKTLKTSAVSIIYPTDDDFVSLMKYIPEDKYVRQWLSRDYELFPLWKSKAEFYEWFPFMVNKQFNSQFWLFSDASKSCIARELGINSNDVWILFPIEKDRRIIPEQVRFYINKKVCGYNEIYSEDKRVVKVKPNPFSYIFIPKIFKNDKDKINKVRMALAKNAKRESVKLNEYKEYEIQNLKISESFKLFINAIKLEMKKYLNKERYE